MTTDEVIALHDAVLRRFRAPHQPLRDRDLLDGALARVQQATFYENLLLAEEAALVAIAISQAQAFTDGNKRTAHVAMVRFLDLSGFRFLGDPLRLAQFLEIQAYLSGVGNPDAALSGRQLFSSWLSDHMVLKDHPRHNVIFPPRRPTLNEDTEKYTLTDEVPSN